MTPKSLSFFAILTALMFPLAQQALAEETASVEDGLSGPVQAWVNAVETGNTNEIAAMFGSNTTAYPPDAAKRIGQEESVTAYEGMFAAYTADVEVTDAQYIEAGGLVHSWGLYTLVLTPKAGGDKITLQGRFTDVAEPFNGGWRYIVDHASLVPAN